MATNKYLDGAGVAQVWQATKDYVAAHSPTVSPAAEALLGDASTDTWAQRVSDGDGVARIESIKGNTVVWNQLNTNTGNTNTLEGVTATYNNDGTWTLNGTSTASAAKARYADDHINAVSGHKYLIRGCPKVEGISVNLSNAAGSQDTGDGVIYTSTFTSQSASLRMAVNAGVSLSNVTVTPQIFDLTAMFGAGNEPTTVAEFEAMYPEPYYPYSAPTLLPVNIAGIATTDADGAALDSRTFDAVTLRAAGAAADVIYADRKATNVGFVDLGTLEWEYVSGNNSRMQAVISGYKAPSTSSIVANMACAKYEVVSLASVWAHTVDKSIALHNNGGAVFVYDTSYTDADTFTEAMDGVYMFYELATPTTTQIDPPLPLTYRVENGGTESIVVPEGEISAAPIIAVAYPKDMAAIMADVRDAVQDMILTYAITESDGYISATGEVTAADATNQEKYTDLIPVGIADPIYYSYHLSSSNTMWLAVCWYGPEKEFINRPVLVNTTGTSASGLVSVPDGAAYLRWTYRTYGTANALASTGAVSSEDLSYWCGVTREQSETPALYAGGANVKSVNHRGFNTVAPENTLPAFRLSKKAGFEYVESDVRFTSDGVAVMLHDESINRTARNADGTELSSTVNIADITYDEALEYDFGVYMGAEYAGTPIPTLSEFMTLCRNIALRPYIEIKAGTQAQMEGLVGIVAAHGMAGKVTWIGSGSAMAIVKGVDEGARLGVVVSTIDASSITAATNLQTASNEVFITSHSYTDAEVALCVNAGIPLEVWTVNNKSALLNLPVYVTGVTSNLLIAERLLYEAAMSEGA